MNGHMIGCSERWCLSVCPQRALGFVRAEAERVAAAIGGELRAYGRGFTVLGPPTGYGRKCFLVEADVAAGLRGEDRTSAMWLGYVFPEGEEA